MTPPHTAPAEQAAREPVAQFTDEDRRIIDILIDVQRGAIGILTALNRINAVTSTPHSEATA